MAVGVRRALGSDVGLALTGVAGPDPEEGVEVGTVFVGLAIGDDAPTSIELRLPGDRRGSATTRRSAHSTSSAAPDLRPHLASGRLSGHSL